MSSATIDNVERVAYRPREAAALLGVSKSRVYEWMAAGQLRYRQVSTQVRLIPRSALIEFAERGSDDE